jgi:hypothetical protein
MKRKPLQLSVAVPGMVPASPHPTPGAVRRIKHKGGVERRKPGAAASPRSEAMKRMKSITLVVTMALVALLAGCAALVGRQAEPVTVPEVVDMSRKGVPAEEIIARIRDSDMVYRLEASQYVELAEQGVPPEVLDYMQQTYLDEIRRNSFLRERRYWTPGAGYWYGGHPFGWPYDRRF